MRKSIILLPLMAMMAILLAGVGNATFSMNLTIVNTTITSTTTLYLNATINNTVESPGALNCSYEYLTSKSGAAWTQLDSNITVLGNATLSGTVYSVLLRRDTLYDIPLYDRYTTTWRVKCGDGTAENSTATTATSNAITLDYTSPECNGISSITNSTTYGTGYRWNVSMRNSSSSCYFYFTQTYNSVSTGNKYTGTIAGGDGDESCSFLSSNNPPESTYTYVVVTASDDTDTTTCSPYSYITIDDSSVTQKTKKVAGAVGAYVEAQQQGASASSGFGEKIFGSKEIMGISSDWVLFGLIAVVLYFWLKKK